MKPRSAQIAKGNRTRAARQRARVAAQTEALRDAIVARSMGMQPLPVDLVDARIARLVEGVRA